MPLSRRARIALVVAPVGVLALLVVALWSRPAGVVVVRNESGAVLPGMQIVTTVRTYELGDVEPGAIVETVLPRDGATTVTVSRGATDGTRHPYSSWSLGNGVLPEITEIRVLEGDGLYLRTRDSFDPFEFRR